MSAWPVVSWTEAGQLLELFGDVFDPAEFADGAHLAPEPFFAGLLARRRFDVALFFIAHALPRYEGVVWAAHVLLDSKAIDRAHPVMNATLRWIDDPSDGLRREVKALADAQGDMSAACMLGLAVFASGGSISLPDLPPVLPPPSASARLAAGALITAAYAGPEPEVLLGRAADAGKAMASQGYTR
jgi:hypothetical protein